MYFLKAMQKCERLMFPKTASLIDIFGEVILARHSAFGSKEALFSALSSMLLLNS